MTTITKNPFGTVNGRENTLYTLKNGDTEVDIMTRGATLVALRTPDKNGNIVDVLCGYAKVEDYCNSSAYMGAIIGRNSNRIANGTFTLNEKTYKLEQNNGTNNLHGGPTGFDSQMWFITEANEALFCCYTAEDGECGYPGRAYVCVTYTLSDNAELTLKYNAICSEDTVMNLTNHAYFNLDGHDSGTIENHTMTIHATEYTPLDENCCPTGEIAPVAGTVFDFTKGRVVRDGIDDVPDFEYTTGYDHNFMLNNNGEYKLAVEVAGAKSGIAMEVYTNKPAVQFYAGNQIEEGPGKDGVPYGKRQGLCLETQFVPNCLAHPNLGSCILRKDAEYSDMTTYKFFIK